VTSPSHDPLWQRPDDVSAGASTTRLGSPSLVDPEDDLPSATYAGDYETTTIPHYGSQAAGGSSALHSLGDPEPLPYVAQQPQPVRQPAVGPAEIEPEDYDAVAKSAGRRGTQDLGLLLLRVGLGAVLIAHGLQRAFGLWGGSGPQTFSNSLSDLGYQHAGILTYVASGTQILAGVLLVLGLFTPLAGAAALAYLINGVIADIAAQENPRQFLFFLPEGHEYQITLILVASAVILAGPGRWGLDAGRGWARRPFVGSFVAFLLGIGGGIAVWMIFNGTNPLA